MKWILCLSLCHSLVALFAQGTTADYQRSDDFRKRYPLKVYKQELDPHWISDNRVFFVDPIGKGKWGYLLADRKQGMRKVEVEEKHFRPVLDKAVPGKSKNLEKDVHVIDIEGDVLVFMYQGKQWAYKPGDDEAQAREGDKRQKIKADPPSTREGPPPTPSGPRSPDKEWTVMIKDHNVWIRHEESKKEHQLSEDGTGENAYRHKVYWAPDATRFMLVRQRKEQPHIVTMVESSPRNRVQPRLKQHNYLKPGDRIRQEQPCLFDVSTLKQIAIDTNAFPNPWKIEQYQWWPDSSAFTFLYNQRGHQVMQVVEIDGKTGNSRALIDERCDTFFDYSSKTYLHLDRGSREMIWMSERSGWNHLYRVDGHTGEARPITKGAWVVRSVIHRDDRERVIWFMACGVYPGQDPYYQHLGRVNFDGTGLIFLTEDDGTHRVKFSPKRKTIIATWSRIDHAPVHQWRSAVDGSLICELARADDKALRASGWKYPERFQAKGRDGKTDIYGMIVRPTHFDPANKYPVIEHIYAGPHGQFVPKRFRESYNITRMAELGFILVMIDGMGTNWRSRKFHDVAWRNIKDGGFPDRIAWLKAAAEKYPSMDLSRVGIYGGSAGGQNALSGLLHFPGFYHAAAADCGCHDNRMDKIWWNEAWMGWPVGDWYAENSNVTHAHKLQGKLLLTVGELDTNVDPASTMQVVNALIKANKDFELIVFPGGGHGVGGSSYGWRRRADFFVRHLMGVEPRRE
ncbi:MAG: prolyl oligopeptidase family serine peptidase [Verrucomicrobiota bacterium]